MYTPVNVPVPSFPSRSLCLSDLTAIRDVFSADAGRVNAKAIQSAIDTLSQEGGGTLVLPCGFWASAPIRLKSNVNLHLEAGAMLKFIKEKEDYPLFITNYEGETAIRTVSPITAENANNIAITGAGTIDGSGDLWRPIKRFKLTDKQWQACLAKGGCVYEGKEVIWFPTESAYKGMELNIQDCSKEGLEKAADYWDFYRPVMVSLRHCKGVLLQGVNFTNSPAWNIHPFFCQDLTVDSITVKNSYWAQNGDGIDVESCDNVHIFNSLFETGDDAICIKSGKNAAARAIKGPSQNMHIHDCTVYQGHGGFVVGSEMSRGVRNILCERCLFIGTDVGVRFKSTLGRGGVVEDIDIRDIRMVDIKNQAIILTMAYVLNRLNNEEGAVMVNEEDVPYFRNIHMDNMVFVGQDEVLRMEPIPGRPETISNIVINGVRYDGENLLK